MMNITPFSPAERKALMEELFPLKRTARDYDLRQDMTLDGYIASVIVRAQRQLDSGTLPSASVQFRRLATLYETILPGRRRNCSALGKMQRRKPERRNDRCRPAYR